MKKPTRSIKCYTNQLSRINYKHSYFRFYALRNRGILYFDEKLYQKAIDDFTSAIDVSDPKMIYRFYWNPPELKLNKIRSRVFFYRGIAYIEKQILDKAIDDLSKSLELYPKIIDENKSKFKILPLEIKRLIKIFFEI